MYYCLVTGWGVMVSLHHYSSLHISMAPSTTMAHHTLSQTTAAQNKLPWHRNRYHDKLQHFGTPRVTAHEVPWHTTYCYDTLLVVSAYHMLPPHTSVHSNHDTPHIKYSMPQCHGTSHHDDTLRHATQLWHNTLPWHSEHSAHVATAQHTRHGTAHFATVQHTCCHGTPLWTTIDYWFCI